MAGTVRTVRGRRRGARLVAMAMIASALVVVAGTTNAAALDPSVCQPAGIPGFPTSYRVVSLDDGGQVSEGTSTFWKYSTSWNGSFAVDAPGVLANDGVAEPGDIIPRLRAILVGQTTYGTVQLHTDGSWTYTPALEHPLDTVIESFQYIAFDAASGLCSENPATVTFEVGGFKEVLGNPPSATVDRFPTDGRALSANEILQVPAPGVLANDWDNDSFPPAPNHNLIARIASQPVWRGTNTPAGTVTDWGKRIDQGVTVFDNSGGFTYTAPATGTGTAEFTYVACYRVRSTAATPCSEPSVVRIDVGLTATARPFTELVDTSGPGGALVALIMANDIADHVTYNGPARMLYPRLGTPAHGTVVSDYWTGPPFGSVQTGDFIGLTYRPGTTFTGTDQFTYRMCDTPTDTSTTVCTNDAVITVEAVDRPPRVVSLTPPVLATDPLIVRFDRDVRGITAANLVVRDVTSPSVTTAVPVELRCTSGRLPGTGPYFCEGNYGDTVYVRPDGGWRTKRYYHVAANFGTSGIVSAAGQVLALEPHSSQFLFVPPDFDRNPPTASPTESVVDGVVTVAWNWTDAGVGINPDWCVSTSTWTPPDDRTVRAWCLDRNGNSATASYEVQSSPGPVDTTPPVASPTTSPPKNGLWHDGDVTVTWNWSDGDGSGIDPAKCPATSTVTTEGVSAVLVACVDLAGNVAISAGVEVRIDRTAPTLAPTVTPSPLLLGAKATATANATDAGSGVVSSSCGPVDTKKLGTRTVQCAATDAVGNTATVSVPYTVGVKVTWVNKPASIKAKAGTQLLLPVVQLFGAGGKPIPDSVARGLPSCSVTFTLGTQKPVCAVFVLTNGLFSAGVTSKSSLPVGTTVPLVAKVTVSSAVLGSTTANLPVKK